MSSGMEPEVQQFLKRIVSTLSVAILWMLVHTLLGIRFNLAFFDKGFRWYNLLYYLFFVGSFIGLIYFFWRTWRDK